MAEEVTRTVENVDRLFGEIVVNGESHVSENYVPPVQMEHTSPQSAVQEEEPQSSVPSQAVQGQDVYAVELNEVLHDFSDRDLTQGLADEVQNRQDADTALQNDINAINSKIPSSASASNQLVDNASLSAVETDVSNIQAVIPSSATPSNKLADASSVSAVQASVSDIEALIPNQASESNQLADKDFVNSSISTNTANFIGTFESVTQLRAYVGTVTNNDYAFVRNTVIQYNGGDFPNVTTLNSYDKTTLTNGDYAWVVNSEDNTKYDLYRFDIVEQSWVLRATKIDKSQDVLNSMFNRYKATVSGSTVTWLYEYSLNNSSFTAQQWATINSGLTQGSVDQDILDAINALDVASQGGNNKYIKAIQQTNGLISATEGTIDTAVTQGSNNPVSSDAVYQALQGGSGANIGDVTRTVSDNVPQGYIDCTVKDETDYHIEQIQFSPKVNKFEYPYLFTADGTYQFALPTDTATKMTNLSVTNEDMLCAWVYSTSGYYRRSCVGTKTGLYYKNSSSNVEPDLKVLSNMEVYAVRKHNDNSGFYACTSDGLYLGTGGYPSSFGKVTISGVTKCYDCIFDSRLYPLIATDNGICYYWNNQSMITNTTGHNFLGCFDPNITQTHIGYFFTADGDVFKVNYSGYSVSVDGIYHICDSPIRSMRYKSGTYYIFTDEGMFVTTDFTTITKEIPNVCKTGEILGNYAYFANNDGFFKHELGNVDRVIKHFEALDKTTYADLYAEIGDKYNSYIQDLPATKFAIPLIKDEDNLYKYIMKV